MKTVPVPPKALVKFQEWFADILDRYSGGAICQEEESRPYLQASPHLPASTRAEIYCHGHLGALVEFLQNNLPLLLLYVGRQKFQEEIACPYFKDLPHHRYETLADMLLSLDFLHWAQKAFVREDREEILTLILADILHKKSSVAEKMEASDSLVPNFFSEPLMLQPHVALLETDSNVFHLRNMILQFERKHWEEHPFPKLQRGEIHRYIVFRNHCDVVVAEELADLQFRFLKCFEEPISCNRALILLQNRYFVESVEDLTSWLQLTCQRGILAAPQPRDRLLSE